MPEIAFDRFYRYADLTALLRAYELEFPDFVEVTSIGKSFEGRDIWLVTVTDKNTGPASEKPAFWVDGNIHASELSASTAAMTVLDLLTQRATPESKALLAGRAIYIVPRLNPDGAEWAMETPPRIVRSSTRPYPYEEEDPYGLERQDIDGDGRILSIRIKDPNGPWKISEEEPRLMKKREPGESGGTYYRLLAEGLFHNFDRMTMRSRKIKEGLDMNRNFPSAWRIESDQHGAGPFPTSEPEIRAAVQAITERPNICGAVTFHTFSGVHLRPPSRMPDDDLPPEDIWAFKALGKKGEEMTGYPAISNFHEFKYHPKEVITGVFDDWMYEHRGVFSWTTEIWSPQRQAGITDYKYIDWFREHPFEDDIKLLAWADKELDGNGYIDWYEFEHPQLGKVELGGWDPLYAFRNPPPNFLGKEVLPLAEWALWQASCSPKLELRDVVVDNIEGAHRIRIAVQNSGWLPTNVAKIAADRKLCRGVVGEITREGSSSDSLGTYEPDWLIAGLLREQRGQLVGWSHVPTSGFGWHTDGTDDVAVFEWVVKPGTYDLVVKHERAGTVRHRTVVG
jgi:murein tripeptide amidase MpaA